MKTFSYNIDICTVWIAESNNTICSIAFAKQPDFEVSETPLIKEAYIQIKDYLAGKRKDFDVPFSFIKGTEFQKKVWRALVDIDYGKTKSYKEVAEQVGSLKGYRAVGMANNKNPIAIIVPCHRVINSNGKLCGYAGGIDVKQRLLDLEKNT